MTRHVSLTVKIEQLQGLLGTKDLNTFEEAFITNMRRYLPPGQTTALTTKQVDILERTWSKHFA